MCLPNKGRYLPGVVTASLRTLIGKGFRPPMCQGATSRPMIIGSRGGVIIGVIPHITMFTPVTPNPLFSKSLLTN